MMAGKSLIKQERLVEKVTIESNGKKLQQKTPP